MFRRRAAPAATVTVRLDGEAVEAAAGDSVAAVLLAAGTDYRRHGVDGTARAPFCMIGNCHDCLVEVDGVANRQGCLVTVAEGMRIRRMRGKPVLAT